MKIIMFPLVPKITDNGFIHQELKKAYSYIYQVKLLPLFMN